MKKFGIISLLFIFTAFRSQAQENEVGPEESDQFSSFPNCELLDLVLIFDASATVKTTTFYEAVQFARKLIPYLNIGLNATRIASIRFSRSSFPFWELKESVSGQVISKSFANVDFGSGGKKRMSSMFSFVGHRTFSYKNGNRRGVPDMVIIFTDGNAKDHPQGKISRLRRRGIQVSIVVIGSNPNLHIINSIASPRNSDNVFRLEDFPLTQVIRTIRRRAMGTCPRAITYKHPVGLIAVKCLYVDVVDCCKFENWYSIATGMMIQSFDGLPHSFLF